MASHARKITALVSKLLDWFSGNARDLPWRRTRDPYAIWVSEIMLQQTQVKTVIPYWERWMRRLPDIRSLAAARPATLHKLWEGLGYYSRVRNLQQAAQRIVSEHGGRFPEDYEAILDLPGIGPYTAGAIASIAFHQSRPILDGNVIRVLTRLFGIQENPREKTTNERLWNLAAELVTAASRSRPRTGLHPVSALNQSLMELGALVCTPKQPGCAGCPVRGGCIARRDGLAEQLPNLGARAKSTARRFAAFVLERDGRFLVRQRPAGVVNARLWEFPNLELEAESGGGTQGTANGRDERVVLAQSKSGTSVAVRKRCRRFALPPHSKVLPPVGDAAVFQRALGLAGGAQGLELDFGIEFREPFMVIKHSITRFRITLEVFRASVPGRLAGEWRTLAELQSLAFPSAHRRILQRLIRDQAV